MIHAHVHSHALLVTYNFVSFWLLSCCSDVVMTSFEML